MVESEEEGEMRLDLNGYIDYVYNRFNTKQKDVCLTPSITGITVFVFNREIKEIF